jgi:tRNA-dihydrouridine synthase 3
VGILERESTTLNERPPPYVGRNDLETLMGSPAVSDWVKITEMLLGPVEDSFNFVPKHKANSYVAAVPTDLLQGARSIGKSDIVAEWKQ